MKRVLEAIEAGLERVVKGEMDSRRLFHGRGHCYPDLEDINVDYHPSLLLITLYKKPDDQVFNKFIELLKSTVTLCIVVQRRYLHQSPSELIQGVLPEKIFAQTGDIRFYLNIGNNQNVGYFLDMQPTHRWLREHAAQKTILNLFSYTCAFSVAALKGGAKSVVNVDMSSGVLSTGRKNHEINDIDPRSSRFMKLDILKSWGRIKKPGPYDLLIIDPPSLQRGSFNAQIDYAKVIKRIPQLLVNGGEVLLCLNAPHLPVDFLIDLMAEQCPGCTFIKRLAASPDFPEKDENRNLKVLLYRYDG